MKVNLFVITLILSLLWSCKKETTAIIQGKIIQPEEDILLIKSSEDEDAVADTVKLDKDGSFLFKISLKKPEFYQLRISSTLILDLFLTPGDELVLNVDMMKPFDEIRFEGKGEKLNNFMLERLMSDKFQLPPRLHLFQLPENEFLKTMDSILNVRINDLNDFNQLVSDSFEKARKKDALEYFTKIYKTNLMFDYAGTLLIYRQNYPYIIKQPDYQFSQNFDTYFRKLDFNQDYLIASRSFRNFISRYLSYLADPEFEQDTVAQKSEIGYNQIRYQKAEELLQNEKVKEYILYSILLEQVNYYGIKEIDKLMNQFRKICKNQEYLKNIEEKIKLWDKIAPGKAAPTFIYPDENGKQYSLTDFKGKLVYLDVWATWCGPCKQEIPHFEKLAAAYSGKNIVFIQISVDDTEADWKNFNKIKGDNIYQLFAGGWKSQISKDYIIKSIPRFILIDQEGKIIDNNAPRPSDPRIKDLINEYLSKLN